jgi:hypothetical protein
MYTLTAAPRSAIKDLETMIPAEDFDGARAVLREYGLERAKERARAHALNALTLLAETELRSESKEFFRDLLGYLVKSLER